VDPTAAARTGAEAATRLINESILGAVLIITILASAGLLWLLWRAWRDERLGRSADAKTHSAELKDMNVQLNTSLRESNEREREAERKADTLAELLERTISRLEAAGK